LGRWTPIRRYDRINSGEYENGVKNGTGTYYFKGEEDGRYEGHWKNGRQEGAGKLFSKDKLVFEGLFRNGEPVRDPPKVQSSAMEHLPSNIAQISSVAPKF